MTSAKRGIESIEVDRRAEQRALRILADVTSYLAGGATSEDVLAGVIGAMARGLGTEGCRVWIRTADGSALMPIVPEGGPSPPAELVHQIQTLVGGREACELRGQTWHLRIPLAHEGERLGLLEACVQDGPDAATLKQVVHLVANILSPMLASIALSEDLASEVALRTLEIDAQRRFTSKIIDSMPVGLYVIDRRYRIQAWNRTRETGTGGVDRQEVIGRAVFDVMHRQPKALLKREFDRVFNTGQMEVIEVESTGDDGQARYYRITKIPMRLDDVEVTHVITIGEEVTDWKAVQQQIAQTERLAAVGQLAAGVMHEINNPLATIGACVEALSLRSGERQKFEEYLRIIDSELARCKNIVDGLLDFSRPKARVKRQVDLNQIVEDALFLIKHHDKFKHIKLVRELRLGLPTINVNAEQLIQVFLALMLNAIDAMEGKGVLTVRTRLSLERSDEVMVEFGDTGGGIPRDELSKIFEPFFTSKQPGRGTGLGLSICYGIVQQHGGRIHVDSQMGRGSLFQVFLPVVAATRTTA
jgi:two-component system NtrC family sensor kinase